MTPERALPGTTAASVQRKERGMKQHQLKAIPPHFGEVLDGEKTFEVRKNDRDFRVGDVLHLNEFIPAGGFTGQSVTVQVTHILPGGDFGIDSEYCVMSIRRLP